MPRTTSVTAYNQIKSEGLLSRVRFEVYSALFLKGPKTASELDEVMKGMSGPHDRGGYWKRLPELRDMGVVHEQGKRVCRVTGREAILWDVTEALPVVVKAPPKPNATEILSALDELVNAYRASGTKSGEDMKKLYRWLRHMARKANS